MTQPHETISVTYYASPNQRQVQDIAVIAEALVSVYVNGIEVVTLACTPIQQKELAVGFLLNEAMIETSDLRVVDVCASGSCVDIWLERSVRRPARRIVTSGCGGGVTFADASRAPAPFDSDVSVSPEEVTSYVERLRQAASLHHQVGGEHTSGLFRGGQLVSMAEDIGRHNTLDKIRGDCALRGIETQGGILVTTGRVSSEMVNKAASLGCPIVVSRTSATSLSARLAQAWSMTLVGYVRGSRMTVYSGAERIKTNSTPKQEGSS